MVSVWWKHVFIWINVLLGTLGIRLLVRLLVKKNYLPGLHILDCYHIHCMYMYWNWLIFCCSHYGTNILPNYSLWHTKLNQLESFQHYRHIAIGIIGLFLASQVVQRALLIFILVIVIALIVIRFLKPCYPF